LELTFATAISLQTAPERLCWQCFCAVCINSDLPTVGISGKEKLTHISLKIHSFAAGFQPFAGTLGRFFVDC
jgi:hypothetical protein